MNAQAVGIALGLAAAFLLLVTLSSKNESVTPVTETPVVEEPVAPDTSAPTNRDTNTIIRDSLGAPPFNKP